MDWRLRRAEADDVDALSFVASGAFLEAFGGLMTGRDAVAHCRHANAPARFTDWIADPVSVVVLAEQGGGAMPVGYTVLTAPDLPVATGPRDLELKRIYTLAVAWGTGVGRALLDRAVVDAGAAGAMRVLLGVHGDNKRARRFYERGGFEVVGERRFLVGATWHDDLVYARDLPER